MDHGFNIDPDWIQSNLRNYSYSGLRTSLSITTLPNLYHYIKSRMTKQEQSCLNEF